MFKIGDKIKCIKKPKTWQFQLKGNCVGKFYKIKRIHPNFIEIENEDGWFTSKLFILYRELLTEIDFLNAIQQNFKEGI